MKKQTSFVIMVIFLTTCLFLAGCSDVIEQSANEIPSDLRNTVWTRQISDTETFTITFGKNTLALSSDEASSQDDQQWNYRGGYCCGNGYCTFYNGQNSLDFRYKCNNNGLDISSSNVKFLTGNWTRK